MPRVIQTSTRLSVTAYEVKELFQSLSILSANSGIVFRFTPDAPGHIVRLDFVTQQPGAGAGADISLTPTVNDVDVTAGVLQLTLANTANTGDEVVGAAIGGGAMFEAGQTVGIRAATATAFTDGWGTLKLQLEYATKPVGPSPT